MKNTTQLILGLVLGSLAFSTSSSAITIYDGTGDIRTGANWDLGLPSPTQDGLINVNATVGGNFNGFAAGSTINQTAGTLTGIVNANSAGLVYNLLGGTINSAAGNFNANGGSIFNILSGEVIFNEDILVNSSVGGITVGGDAIIRTASDFDLRLNQDNAFFEVESDWTGSFVSGNDSTEAQWIAELVFGAGPAGSGGTAVNPLRQITVGGVGIDETNFGDFFEVTPDGGSGSTLRLIPEPSSGLLLGLGGLALLFRRRK